MRGMSHVVACLVGVYLLVHRVDLARSNQSTLNHNSNYYHPPIQSRGFRHRFNYQQMPAVHLDSRQKTLRATLPSPFNEPNRRTHYVSSSLPPILPVGPFRSGSRKYQNIINIQTSLNSKQNPFIPPISDASLRTKIPAPASYNVKKRRARVNSMGNSDGIVSAGRRVGITNDRTPSLLSLREQAPSLPDFKNRTVNKNTKRKENTFINIVDRRGEIPGNNFIAAIDRPQTVRKSSSRGTIQRNLYGSNVFNPLGPGPYRQGNPRDKSNEILVQRISKLLKSLPRPTEQHYISPDMRRPYLRDIQHDRRTVNLQREINQVPLTTARPLTTTPRTVNVAFGAYTRMPTQNALPPSKLSTVRKETIYAIPKDVTQQKLLLMLLLRRFGLIAIPVKIGGVNQIIHGNNGSLVNPIDSLMQQIPPTTTNPTVIATTPQLTINNAARSRALAIIRQRAPMNFMKFLGFPDYALYGAIEQPVPVATIPTQAAMTVTQAPLNTTTVPVTISPAQFAALQASVHERPCGRNRTTTHFHTPGMERFQQSQVDAMFSMFTTCVCHPCTDCELRPPSSVALADEECGAKQALQYCCCCEGP